MLRFISSNPHFFIVVSVAIVCKILALINYLRFKKEILFRYLLFYFASIMASFQSTINPYLNISNLIFSVFFTFDFIFFLSFTSKPLLNTYKFQNTKPFYLSLVLLIIYFIFYKNPLSIHFLTLIYSMLVLSLSIPFMKGFLLDTENNINVKEHEYWIISAFLICSIASFACSFMILFTEKSSKNIMYLLLFLTMYISWIIKYIMLLKSNLCLAKSIKFGV